MGVERTIYPGGLGTHEASSGVRLSRHLESRHRVDDVLAAGPVDVTEPRAAVIIGAGSASFEMPRYLVIVLSVPETAGRTLEISGPSHCGRRRSPGGAARRG